MSTVKVVKFDAGHGGYDSGALGNGLVEKTLTLRIALLAEKYLLEGYTGVAVQQTRRGDSAVALPNRTNNLKGVSALVSIHINSATNAAAIGYEDFRHTSQTITSPSGKLQAAIHKRVMALGLFTKDRGMKQANYHMVREGLPIASTLLEFGFIVNKTDAAILKNDGNLQKLAKAVADGTADFLGLKKAAAAKPSVTVPSEREGVATMKVDGVKEYSEPSFDSEVMRTHKKGDTRNIYGVRDGWYLTFSGYWIPSNYFKNFDYKADGAKADKEPPKVSDLMRVTADGKPLGAFRDYDNMTAEAERAVKAGAKVVKLERV